MGRVVQHLPRTGRLAAAELPGAELAVLMLETVVPPALRWGGLSLSLSVSLSGQELVGSAQARSGWQWSVWPRGWLQAGGLRGCSIDMAI